VAKLNIAVDYIHRMGNCKLTLYIRVCPPMHFLEAGKWLKSDLHATLAFILASETLALEYIAKALSYLYLLERSYLLA
jgi:hypothetical protein